MLLNAVLFLRPYILHILYLIFYNFGFAPHLHCGKCEKKAKILKHPTCENGHNSKTAKHIADHIF